LEFQRSLPAKRMGAGLLLRDAQGQVLMVEPTYKPNWEIPGGAVDADESPRECVVREVGEELGIGVTPGRLLVIDYQHPEPGRTESIMFVFDGGVVDTAWTGRIQLPADELRGWRFVALDELSELTSPRLCRRIGQALTAASDGQTLYLENGQRCPQSTHR
jgi:8-oxo-dGTP diphosphatase